MFQTLKASIPRDKDYPPRQFEIDILTRVLRGKLYETLKYDFYQEKVDGIGEYIPLRNRRPSVRYALCRVVVDDSVSLLFSESHFPTIQSDNEAVAAALVGVIKESKLNEVMIEAATIGAVGSVAVLMRVLSNRVFFKAMNTQFLAPTWKADAPDTLAKVVEKYKVKGQVLRDSGYAIEEADITLDFWFCRTWDEQAETWFQPIQVGKPLAWVVDKAKTTAHGLGYVPMAWVRNLPGGDDIDGDPTFPSEVIDTQIEIDYQLSQAGRGLKYSSDPTLLIKEPAMGDDGVMVKGAGNALVVSKDGDAKMLEIGGTAAKAVIEYVNCLREMALESAHGNRSSADKMAAAQSGRAMEIMNAALINLADKLRISYGEGALLSLLTMVVRARAKMEIKVKGKVLPEFPQDAALSLRWPAWYAPTYADKQSQALTLTALCTTGLMSRETAVNALASAYDIEDVPKELAAIKADPMTPPAPLGAGGKPNPDAND